MTYEEALDWLYAGQQRGIKLGLTHVRRLLVALGNPQSRFAVMHIAGTNGKGSVAAMAAMLLRAHGVRTALFTSPHLVDFRERIQIDGEMISREACVEGLVRIRRIVDQWDEQPTFFEIVTALAFDYFAQQKIDWAVVEVGMGGRLDSTNCVMPEVSVITQIGMDHQAWLGGTLEEIAREKAGIIKPSVPILTFTQNEQVLNTLRACAMEVGSPLEVVDEIYTGELSLLGNHQRRNAALAVKAVERGMREFAKKANAKAAAPAVAFDSTKVAWALTNTVWPGRFQIIDDRYVLDGAHNQSSIDRLVSTWQEVFPGERPSIVFGACQDKEYALLIASLRKIAEEFVFVPINNARAVDPGELLRAFEGLEELEGLEGLEAENHGGRITATIAYSVADGLERARLSNRRILFAGSLFLIGEVLSLLQKRAYPRQTLQ